MQNKIIGKLPYFLKKLFKIPYAKHYFNANILPKNRKFDKIVESKTELKNILYINSYSGSGGASKIAHNSLCKNFQKKGYDTKILADKAFGTTGGEPEVQLINKVQNNDQKILYRAQGELGWLDFFHLSTFELKNTQEFKNADIVHLNNLHGNYFNLFALPEITSLKPVIWTLHDQFAMTGHCASPCECERWLTGCEVCPDLSNVPAISKDTAKFLYEIKKSIYENSNLTVVANSNWMLGNINKSILKNNNIKLIHNGIDVNTFKPYNRAEARNELGLPLDKKILMFSSNLGLNNSLKGTKYLLDAYEHLKDRDDILFISVGGEKKEYIKENFLGFPYIHSEIEMAKLYSAADLFVFPTLAETFGLVIAEALACETPVITFEIGPIPEIVRHMETGYIAKYRNSKDFIFGIELFLNDESLLTQAVKSARENIVNNFSLQKMLEEYEKLYHESFNNYYLQKC